MLLERFLMKLFAPRRLARRDTMRVWQVLDAAKHHTEQGQMIAHATDIPEHDLYHLLGLMEREGFIERDPGPFDQTWVRDRFAAWWAPGKHWPDLTEFYQGSK
jgi:DNA-binding MarR family transcriptional regulator